MTGAAYRPGAAGPEFTKFLERVQPDEAMRAYLARLTGHALEGRVYRAPPADPLRRRRQREMHVHRRRRWPRSATTPTPPTPNCSPPGLRRPPDRRRRPVRAAAGGAARIRPRPAPGRGHRQAAHRRRPAQGPPDARGLLVLRPVPHLRHADQPQARRRRHRRGHLAAAPAGPLGRRHPRSGTGRGTRRQLAARARRRARLAGRRLPDWREHGLGDPEQVIDATAAYRADPTR